MKVLSIIVTYNALRNDWLYKCLDSLLSSEKQTDIIVIDNGSTDETCIVLKNKYPSIILVENNENKGFGKANNQGFEYGIKSGSQYFFLINQDAWIETDTIEKLITAHQKEPQYGILSPMHLNGKGNALDYNFSIYINPTKCYNLYSDIYRKDIKKGLYEVDFVNAAAWLLSKECIETVGGFNPSFFHYGEDNNFIQRTKYKKLKVGVLPECNIFHDREKRSENNYFKNELLLFERIVILKVSDPFNRNNFQFEYLKIFKGIIKSIVFLRMKVLKNNISKIRILNQLDKQTILKNKSKSKFEKLSFLNA